MSYKKSFKKKFELFVNITSSTIIICGEVLWFMNQIKLM